MPCVNKNCKVRTNLNREGLCQSCEQFWNDMSRRKEHQGRQQQAREAAHDSRRNLGDRYQAAPEQPPQLALGRPLPPQPLPQPGPLPSNATTALPTGPPPADIVHYPPVEVNLADLTQTYNQLRRSGSQVAPDTSNKLLVDIYGMMVNMSAKQSEIDTVKKVVKTNTNRISELEAKIGNADQVSIPLGIAIRHLPPPPQGTSELQQVRNVLAAVRAEGVDPQTDVVKAVREGFKAESRPGMSDGWLGTVLVELKSEEIKTKLMKTKKILESHPNQVLRNLIIKNAKTKPEMRMERMANSLLKLNPQGQNFYFAANGNLRPKNQPYSAASQPPQNNSWQPRNLLPPRPLTNQTPYHMYGQPPPRVTSNPYQAPPPAHPAPGNKQQDLGYLPQQPHVPHDIRQHTGHLRQTVLPSPAHPYHVQQPAPAGYHPHPHGHHGVQHLAGGQHHDATQSLPHLAVPTPQLDPVQDVRITQQRESGSPPSPLGQDIVPAPPLGEEGGALEQHPHHQQYEEPVTGPSGIQHQQHDYSQPQNRFEQINIQGFSFGDSGSDDDQ